MAAGPNTLDYSNLNTTLKTTRAIEGVTADTVKAIGDVFLMTSPETRRLKKDSKENIGKKNDKLNEVANSLKGGSEEIKTKFIMNIKYLSENGLLNPASIKSLKIKGKDANEKLTNIIEDLKAQLSEQDKSQLEKSVSEGLEKHYLDLAKKDDMSEKLKTRNDELEEELNASEAANEVVESAILKRWSTNNMIRVGKSIERINDDTGLDVVTKARKVLWQANNFAIFGSGKRFDWINKLPRKIDVNKEYRDAVDNLKTKMDSANDPKEKVAIRYIMRQINKAYTEYVNVTNISEEDRRRNMREINAKMAA